MAKLQVVVAGHCPNCGEARRLAEAASARFPQLTVEVVDLEVPESPRVDVVAVPAYLLDGRVVALGNPAPDRLFRTVSASLEQETDDGG